VSFLAEIMYGEGGVVVPRPSVYYCLRRAMLGFALLTSTYGTMISRVVNRDEA